MKDLKTLGWPGLTGGLALLLALALMALDERSHADAARLKAAAKTLQLRPIVVAAAGAASAPLTPQQWVARLPPSSQRQQRLADLLDLAIQMGLQGVRTEHRLSSSDGIERLRVTMPVSGSYAQVRRLIEGALTSDPALSLDALKIRRAYPQATEVEAELQWSMFAGVGT